MDQASCEGEPAFRSNFTHFLSFGREDPVNESDSACHAPEGFNVCNDNALEALVGPFYERRHVDAHDRPVYTLAARVHGALTGAVDRAHGGFILMLLDQAMGLAAHDALNAAAFTISMHADFIGPARVGMFVETHAYATSTTSSFAFMSAIVEIDGRTIASGTGVWRRQRLVSNAPPGQNAAGTFDAAS